MIPRIVITGATGWIGTALLAHLARRFGPGWTKSVALFGSTVRTLPTHDSQVLPIRLLSDLSATDLDEAIVIHLAYLTKEKVDTLGERQFTDTNLAIDDHLLRALAGARPRALFIASSGAAKLAAEGRDRHPYGLCKLRQEDRFLNWGQSSGTPVIAGRIFNIAGPYINKIESYAIGSFAMQAAETGSIRIKASVPQFRSFLHVDDLCGLIIDAAMLGVERHHAIDLCGGETVEMAEIAAAVANCYESGTIGLSRGEVDWSQPSIYLGDPTHTKTLAMQVGRQLRRFDEQVVDTLAWLREHHDAIKCFGGEGRARGRAFFSRVGTGPPAEML